MSKDTESEDEKVVDLSFALGGFPAWVMADPSFPNVLTTTYGLFSTSGHKQGGWGGQRIGELSPAHVSVNLVYYRLGFSTNRPDSDMFSHLSQCQCHCLVLD